MESLLRSRRHVIPSLLNARCASTPYRHWLLNDVLSSDVCKELVALPITPARIGDTLGKRDTHNATRVFFDPPNCAEYPVMGAVADEFQDDDVTRAIERVCGVSLSGTSLRIEFCQDMEGFWLEPHTDLGVKKFTMTIYLCQGEGAEDWGTDIYDSARRRVARSPCGFNNGMMFVPAKDTYHGFERRPIHGVRNSLIVNYVGPEWRSRHELAYPDQPIG